MCIFGLRRRISESYFRDPTDTIVEEPVPVTLRTSFLGRKSAFNRKRTNPAPNIEAQQQGSTSSSTGKKIFVLLEPSPNERSKVTSIEEISASVPNKRVADGNVNDTKKEEKKENDLNSSANKKKTEEATPKDEKNNIDTTIKELLKKTSSSQKPSSESRNKMVYTVLKTPLRFERHIINPVLEVSASDTKAICHSRKRMISWRRSWPWTKKKYS